VDRIRKTSLKWLQTMKISWSFYMSYRLNFVLQVFGPAIVFFVIKINLWSSVFNADETTLINGYTFSTMVAYHAWVMVVSLMGQGHTGVNLAEDIRHGRISSYLIYPIEFWEFHTAGFLAFQCIQFFSAIIFLFLLWAASFLALPSILILCQGIFYIFCVGVFWYALQYFTGLMAFYLEETWMFRVLIQVIVGFLSGSLMPIDFFPNWLLELIKYTPFPYMGYYPVKILMGEMTFSMTYPLILLFWLIPVLFLNSFIWKRGLRMYTAAGM
jgi:ABC-2 type transport system permease protein